MSFQCHKLKRQVEESCSGCDDCPGDAEAVVHLASFLFVGEDDLTPEMESELAGNGWERV